MLVVRRRDEGSVRVWCVCVFVCLVCLYICRTEGGWGGRWNVFGAGSLASDPVEIEGISCSVCRLHSQPLPPSSAVVYLRTWPWAYPNPLPLLFSPFAVSFPPTPSLFSPSITPSHHHPSVCFPDSSTLLLFFYSLLPWFYLSLSSFQSPLLHPFIPFVSFFWGSLSTPQGRSMGLMNTESPEQISLSICRRIPRSAPLIVSRKQSVY